MTRKPEKVRNVHGPENAEHELRKAYNTAIETCITYFRGKQDPIEGVDPNEILNFYRRAYNCYRKGDRLAAERWARSTKHLARAFWHEAKITYLDAQLPDLPFLEGARPDDYSLHEYSDTTEDLLDSLANYVPPGFVAIPKDMAHYLWRGRRHLETLKNENYRHELARAERIKCAHEYGRVLECMALAHEAEAQSKKAA